MNRALIGCAQPCTILGRATLAGLCLALTSCAVHHASTSMEVEKNFLKDAPERTFEVRYLAQVEEIPAGTKKLRLWWPVPSSTSLQQISDLKFSGPDTPRVGQETKYGNRIASVELENPPSRVEFEMSFTCQRREAQVALEQLSHDGVDPEGAYRVFLEPDRLVVADEEIRSQAREVTEGKNNTVDKARAIYHSVMATMTYDKSGKGWGRGDSRFACEVGKGNCTDFHALFNAMCRVSGIASGFEIGLYLPYGVSPDRNWVKSSSGYHCWAAFRVPGKTWVPVDISEADRFPERADFFFGGHTANRVVLSTGRDIVLTPPQDGNPLNYLLDPYAELDGTAHTAVTKTWYHRDM